MRLKAFVDFALKKVMHQDNPAASSSGVDTQLYRDAANFELSQDSFAEAFDMPRNSIFVQRIFELGDRDGSGFISINEFVDVLAVLCNGTPVQKMRLLFEMYDVDRNGTLSLEEIRAMVRSTLEMNNKHVQSNDETIENVLNSMLEAADI